MCTLTRTYLKSKPTPIVRLSASLPQYECESRFLVSYCFNRIEYAQCAFLCIYAQCALLCIFGLDPFFLCAFTDNVRFCAFMHNVPFCAFLDSVCFSFVRTCDISPFLLLMPREIRREEGRGWTLGRPVSSLTPADDGHWGCSLLG